MVFVEVVLHEAGRHVHAETVHALVHPERHDILELPAHRHRPGCVHRLFPRMGGIRVRETEIQRRLGVEEVLDVIGAARRIGRHELAQERGTRAHPDGIVQRPAGAGTRGRILRLEGRPDVIVRIPQVRRLLGLEEPLALVRRMARHQVHHDLDAARMGLLNQFHQVGIGAEARVHPVKVDDVVTAVRPARYIHRIEPDGRHTDGLDIVQAGNDARDVANAVPVSVLEGRRINLVEHSIAQPARLRRILRRRTGRRHSARKRASQKSVFHSRLFIGDASAERPSQRRPRNRLRLGQRP